MELRTNRQHLVRQSFVGEVTDPLININMPYRITSEGHLMVLPGTGGITYNVRVGDSAVNWVGDHVEPAVSIRHPNSNIESHHNGGLHVMSCIGNSVRVVNGDAKGAMGRVTGKHGGIYTVMVDFTEEDMENMCVNDRMLVKTFGQGLVLVDFPHIRVMNLDPDLMNVMSIEGDVLKGTLNIPVTHILSAAIMGSGLGRANCYAGDYDIQMFDEKTVNEYNLNTLRLGDIVAITDADHSYGRIYKTGAISVGVIVHSGSVVAGHGPGVATLFTSSTGDINPIIDNNANLSNYFQLLGKK